jgi:hypothetical protein
MANEAMNENGCGFLKIFEQTLSLVVVGEQYSLS